MGKGYNNYMCKKPFHPGSKANIKRAWMAEQKTENEKRKQEELKVQYEKEQDLYNNRALISNESKDKLELNFMYEAPPGAKRERQKEDDEPEFKFEWQRKYNAPREDYAKGNADIKDQPFGIPVRNVRCIKCHKWGHINTDKECPLFSQASTSSMPTTSMDPMELMRQMREDGYNLKENVLGHQLNPKAANQQLIPSDESDPEMEFLKSLSAFEKKKLLRKLKKLSKKQEKSSKYKKKKGKKSGKSKSNSKAESDHHSRKKRQVKESSDDSVSESSSEDSLSDDKKKKHVKKSKRKRDASSSSDSDSKSEEEPRKSKRTKHESCHLNIEKTRKKSSAKAGSSKSKEKYSESEIVSEDEPKKSKSTKQKSSDSKTKNAEKKKVSAKYEASKHKEKYSDSESESENNHSKSSNKLNKEKSKHSIEEKKNNQRLDQFSKKRKHSGSKTLSGENKEEKNKSKYTKIDSHKQSPNKREETDDKHYNVELQNIKDNKSDIDIDDSKSEGKSSKLSQSEEPDKSDDYKLKNDAQKNLETQKEDKNSSSVGDTKCVPNTHPDGFSHLCPQIRVETNYLQTKEEYQGNIHDKFRHFHRERRSPSVKQKYNK